MDARTRQGGKKKCRECNQFEDLVEDMRCTTCATPEDKLEECRTCKKKMGCEDSEGGGPQGWQELQDT
ncbi:hypothetical protein Pcinc_002161 [Petrolisthes cinctipes]|uniref:Uncharacterized protein n=1 Tax=Petrolisthes cinctipes TaxID=88211 RepID=A0AAE1GJB3_PETCI|nr:hypothetical protein Pcinc_002161 [Petrolisthes cinctipes]